MELVLACAAAAAVLLGPGGLVAFLLRVAGLWWLAAAPMLSVTIIALAGVIGGLIRVPFTVWLLLGVTAVAAGLALAIRLIWRSLRPLGAWGRDTTWIAGAIAISGLAIGLVAFGGLDLSRSLSQTFDGVFHLNAVAYVLETGNASSFDLYKMTQRGEANEFYPAAWHSLVALTVQLSGSTIVVATNVVWIMTSALLWATGVTMFAVTVLHGRVTQRAAGVVAALLGSCSATFPYLLLSWGTLYPTGLAYAALPLGLALGVALVRGTEKAVGVPWILGAAWGSAMCFAHPRSIPSVLVVAGPLLLFASIPLVRRLWSRRELRRRIVLVSAAGLIAVATGVLTVWDYVYRTYDVAHRPISEHLNGGPAVARQTIGDGLLQVIAQAPVLAPSEMPATPSVALAVAVLAGLVLALRFPELRWLAFSALLVTFLYALAAGSNSDFAKLATGAWYKDKYRLLSLLAVVTVPLATVAISTVGRWMGSRLANQRALTAVVTAVVVSTSWIALVFGGPREAVESVFVVRDQKAGALLDTREFELLQRVGDFVAEGEEIAGDPWNGSGLSWALGDRRSMFPHFVGDWTPDELIIASSLDSARDDPAVCAAVRRESLEYVFDDREYLWGTPPPEASLYEGLRRAVETDVVVPIATKGTATLYRIVAC